MSSAQIVAVHELPTQATWRDDDNTEWKLEMRVRDGVLSVWLIDASATHYAGTRIARVELASEAVRLQRLHTLIGSKIVENLLEALESDTE